VTEFLAYLVRVLPALIPLGVLLFVLPRNLRWIRFFLYAFAFLVGRDAMTPAGLWTIDDSLHLRFTAPGEILIVIGLLSAGIVLLIQKTEPSLKDVPVWFAGSRAAGVGLGLLAVVVILLLPFGFHRLSAGEPPPVANGALYVVGVVVLALLGNLLEEALFRGYFQGLLLDEGVSAVRAALASGIFFGVCHGLLATATTDAGAPLMLFTIYEGVVAAFVRLRSGVIPAAIAHGGAVCLLSLGVV
jgi:hypothetical protein